MIKRKADTVLKVSEPAPLMDFLIEDGRHGSFIR